MRTELQCLKDELSQWEQYCLRYVVHHLRHGGGEGAGARVRKLACDLRYAYVESKAQAGMVFELAREYKSEEGSRISGGSSRKGNTQGGAERNEDMHSFYRFALEHGGFLNERPHATRQCALN
jgi:hypothetical protein